ncbi:MAG: hypothetical protein ACYC3G_00845 [Minisyncoccota bacterium]
MAKTVQPERPHLERRQKSRRMHVKLTDKERVVFTYWYTCLRDVLNKELRKAKIKFFILKPKNKDCALPKDAVRQELRHIFYEDWKCSVDFNDIDNTVHMKDIR